MQQQRFNFDKRVADEPMHVAFATSLPPPLVRPDRQLIYGGVHYWEWPEPDHDRDTITVDRLRDDIDGPPHRFVIKCGDTVEVFFSNVRIEVGKVTGINHVRQEVRVLFQKERKRQWFAKDRIYPTPKSLPQRRKR
jgi:hypothetical protein